MIKPQLANSFFHPNNILQLIHFTAMLEKDTHQILTTERLKAKPVFS